MVHLHQIRIQDFIFTPQNFLDLYNYGFQGDVSLVMLDNA
jgi:hypothetical protein